MNNKTLFWGILGVGFGGVLGTAVFSPLNMSTAVAAAGGALAGTSVTIEYRRKKENETVEAVKVAKSFSYLYETNRGLLNPQQLSFSSDIPVDKSEVFLSALAESQGGQRIETETGVVYKFPHPQNVLDRLAENATAWVEEQKKPLEQENLILKQQLNAFQAVINSTKPNFEPTLTQNPIASFIPNPSTLNKSKETVGAWSNLL
jgi:hypothetical protein